MAHDPDPAMMAAPEALARFLETRNEAMLWSVFSDSDDVTILENFPPHLFRGRAGVSRWRELMAEHVGKLEQLRHAFGPAQDYGETEDQAFFTLPTAWTGLRDGMPFTEHGGWSFLMAREEQGWRIRAYAWAVTSFT
ncbi:hypothetical protein [Sphingosinicella sp. BN140058]|uniref:hypothetical protein n=1 Tax=Sphingosinicella sp. BN140058 TaxID=1892855 RepID=UPI0010123430|nr:hypothetical protein [Sphingosinicella sp. BN140058]QAY75920.1 hypothetical protein ETR14_04785 [Sphingosinicella sp. BN140058]